MREATMNRDAANSSSTELANETRKFLDEAQQLVGDLAWVRNQLTALAPHQSVGSAPLDAQPVDGELQLLRSLTQLQQARSDVGLLERSICALDAEIESAININQCPVSTERASS
jgi:hypothetical protein